MDHIDVLSVGYGQIQVGGICQYSRAQIKRRIATEVCEVPVAIEQITKQVRFAVRVPVELTIRTSQGRRQSARCGRWQVVDDDLDTGRTDVSALVLGLQMQSNARFLGHAERRPVGQ